MSRPHAVVLAAGGIASLVAATLAQKNAEPASLRLTLLYAGDGSETDGLRFRHVKAQAETLTAARVQRIEMAHLLSRTAGLNPGHRPTGTLVAPQLLLAAMSHAMDYEASRVIWPIGNALSTEATTRLANTVLLVDGLARAERKTPPTIETPLSELEPAQIIRLGEELRVDWSLAWSCLRKGRVPCGNCDGCRERASAFQAAGLRDPLEAADRVLART
ncbi:7-cyano-7-deazaguanine synthase [Mucisphaera sp.]|uniref:7-cyano-7-deazaguanine synthase n=1 Tax=Mucisphaera sp. TaxID=2913024 RepID=UPI003D105DC8